MNRDGHNNVNFFTGQEVEHTPAFGERTLFVVGVQSLAEIQEWLDDFAAYEDTSKHIKHIYFGANMSFPATTHADDSKAWSPWEIMIRYFLDQDYLCTLDIDVACAEGLLESGLTEYKNFIPMISVKLPYIQQLGYNATLKLDDKDFDATNPGVWCHSVHELQTRARFTPWSKYSKDEKL